MRTHGESTDLGDVFMSVARELRRRQSQALEPFGLTPSENRALRMLSHGEPLRLGDLAARLRVVPRSATDVADSLERAGLVERTPDPDDRRATLLSLTADGTELLRQLTEARQREANGFFDTLTEPQRRTLTDLLGKLSDYSGAGRPSR